MSGPSQVGPGLSARRVVVGAGALLVAAAGLVVALQDEPQRIAVRVDCTDVAACALADAVALDVWSEQRGPGIPLDVVVDADGLAALDAGGVPFTVLDEDIDRTARAESERLATTVMASATDAPAQWFAEFRDYTAIEARLRALAEEFPDRATLHVIGNSLDGREIVALQIRRAASAGDDDAAPVPMLVNGTQHAREWIAAMTATCVADRIVRGAGDDGDDDIRAFVDGTELWVVPVVNPDGYQYAWGQDRYWRKNRRGGHGVDLNRNWSVAFGGTGSSSNKRSETYRGEGPFSEPESAALRDLARREAVELHVDFHAYGQLVLYPWNHSARRTDDHARLAGIGDRMASAIFAEHQTPYRLIRGVELYPAAGTMTDYLYGEASALSFTIELRPKGGSGFVLPPAQITPTCDEGLAAVLALRASYSSASGR